MIDIPDHPDIASAMATGYPQAILHGINRNLITVKSAVNVWMMKTNMKTMLTTSYVKIACVVYIRDGGD